MPESITLATKNVNGESVALYGNDTMTQLGLVLDELRVNEKYNQPPEKLNKAYDACLEGRVAHGDIRGSYRVRSAQEAEGSYDTRDGLCTCKWAITHPSARYGCYHGVAAVMYARWQQNITPLTMPFPQPVAAPEETPMALEAPTMAQETTLPVSAVSTLDASYAAWGEERKVITRFIKQHLVENSDYGRIHYVKKETCNRGQACTIPSHFTKPCLFKSGSEKFVGLFQLRVTFRKDEDTWEMLGRPAGVICLVCTLVTREGDVAGEGRGVSDVKREYGDANKAVKMAEKAAQLDAVLRTGCLSDVFTQDLEDQEESEAPGMSPTATPEATASASAILRRQKEQIIYFLRGLGHAPVDNLGYAKLVQDYTGLMLEEKNFAAIVEKLLSLKPAATKTA